MADAEPPPPYSETDPLHDEKVILSKEEFVKLTEGLKDLGEIKKMLDKRKRPKTTILRKLFYISDQMVDFYRNSGLILPESFKLVTEKRMANSGIMVLLITRYIQKEGLKNLGRFKFDERMKKYFSNTHYILDGKKITKVPSIFRPINEGETFQGNTKMTEKIEARIVNGDKSMIDILSERTNKRDNTKCYDAEGCQFFSIMVLNNYYRIPDCLVSAEGKAYLEDNENLDMGTDLIKYLSDNKVV